MSRRWNETIWWNLENTLIPRICVAVFGLAFWPMTTYGSWLLVLIVAVSAAIALFTDHRPSTAVALALFPLILGLLVAVAVPGAVDFFEHPLATRTDMSVPLPATYAYTLDGPQGLRIGVALIIFVILAAYVRIQRARGAPLL